MEEKYHFSAFYKGLQTLFVAILTIELLAFICAFTFQSETTKWHFENENTLFYSVIILIIGVSVIGFMGKNWSNKALEEPDPAVRMAKYRTGTVLNWAVRELTVLALCFSYFISGQKFFLLIAFFEVVLLLLQRPDRDKLINDLRLNEG